MATMKPPRSTGLHWTQESVQRHLELVSKTLSKISFGNTTSNADPDMNLDVWKATGTTPGVANTTFTVSHNLYRVPIGFLIVRTNAACHIFDSGIAWTAATNSALGTISLKCDAPTVTFTIIIH